MLFDREFIKDGSISRKLSGWLHQAFEKRLAADYGEHVEVTKQEAARLADEAEEFVAVVKAYLERLGV